MKNWLLGKTIVLTGSSGGIGAQLCKILIKKYGASVIGIGRSEQKMQALSDSLGCDADKFSYKLMDVSKKECWQDFAHFLDQNAITPSLLINNAGVFPYFSKATSMPSQFAEEVIKTNFLSCVYACEALLPIISRASAPAVYFVSSSSALCSVPGSAYYAASKSAMKAYAETLILENKGKAYVGIAFPGTTATDLFRGDERTKNSALDKVAAPPEKTAKKIAKAIIKRKKRVIVGADARFMSFIAKIAPVKGPMLLRNIMKASKSKVFAGVFDYEQK